MVSDLATEHSTNATSWPRNPWVGQSTTIWSGLLIALCVAIGALSAGAIALRSSAFAVSALIQSAPVVLGGVDQSDAASSYVRTELLYTSIYAAGMEAAAEAASGLASPDPVSIELRAGTTVLFFNSRAPTAPGAVAIANASASYYVDQWRARTLDGLNKSIQILNEQIASLPAGSPSAEGLAERRLDIETQISSVQSADRFVGRATEEVAAPTVSALGGAMLGGLAGFVVAVALLIPINRRRAGRRDVGLPSVDADQ